MFTDKDSCRAYLEANGVDTIAWGSGKAKRIQDLMKELEEKESTLQVVNKKLYRITGVVKLVVRHPELRSRHLMCYSQQMADGRKRSRNVLLSEKKRADETPHNAALRAIKEELGSVSTLQADGIVLRVLRESHIYWEELVESPSYPNLVTVYKLNQFEIMLRGLPSDEFATTEDGEDGRKKINYWRWVRDSPDDNRYKGESSGQSALPTTSAPPTTAGGAEATGEGTEAKAKVAGFSVAFINSPMGSATYWPAKIERRQGSARQWLHEVGDRAGAVVGMGSRAASPPPSRPASARARLVPPHVVRLRRLEPASRPGSAPGLQARAALTKPKRLAAPPCATPNSPRLRLPLRRAASPLPDDDADSALELAHPQPSRPRHRLLYVRPGLEASTHLPWPSTLTFRGLPHPLSVTFHQIRASRPRGSVERQW